jgi:3-phytase
MAIVSRKTGPREGYLWQYQLLIRGNKVEGRKVRAFGAFSGQGEIEAVAVDPERELVYYSDEDCCVRVYPADPDHPASCQTRSPFCREGFGGNREGIAVAGPYVIVTDQLHPRSEYHVYRRSDWQAVAVWRGSSQSTDGIDAVARPMGPRFPRGFLVAMNSAAHNFHLYAWPE